MTHYCSGTQEQIDACLRSLDAYRLHTANVPFAKEIGIIIVAIFILLLVYIGYTYLKEEYYGSTSGAGEKI